MAESFLEGVPDTDLVERVLEQAIQTGATVTVADSPELADAGGVAAILRWCPGPGPHTRVRAR